MFEIAHLDEHLVAIAKPPGWLVHRSPIDRHETRIVVQALRSQLGGRHVHPVHRLDKGTSGLLLLALGADAARNLGAQFQDGSVRKTYWAVVRGWPDAQGTIDHALVPDEGGGAAQPALTHYRRLATSELPHAVDRYPTTRYALVELEPRTGRRHQLRRHLKHIAHPIIGDATHGKGCHNRFVAQHFGCDRLLLACVALECRHPASGAPLRLRWPVQDAFAAVLPRLGLEVAAPA